MAGDVIELQANAADAIDLRPTWFISDSTVNETVVITEEERTHTHKKMEQLIFCCCCYSAANKSKLHYLLVLVLV